MGFATHFMADLYLCQNQLWLAPKAFMEKIYALASFKNIPEVEFVFNSMTAERVRISGQFDGSFVLIQILPDASFLTIDIFSWNPKTDVKVFCESLIEIFAPQVVAAESKIRAEHLHSPEQ